MDEPKRPRTKATPIAPIDVTTISESERRLAAQLDVSRVLAEAADPDEAAAKTLEVIGGRLGWECGGFWAVDRPEDVVRRASSWRAPGPALPERDADDGPARLAGGSAFAAHVGATGEPIWIADAATGVGPPALAIAAAGWRSGSGLPLLVERQVVGVLAFFSRAPRRADPGLLATMVALGNQVGQFMARKRAEAALREAGARTSAVLASVLDAIITIDGGGRILEFNPAAERIFGYARDEVIGEEMAELIVPASLRELHRHGFELCVTTGEGPLLGRRIEMTALRADGTEFPVELIITRAPLGGPPVFTGWVRDITDRRRAEEGQRRRARQQVAAGELGRRALAGDDLTALLDDAVTRVADALGVEYARVLELRLGGHDLVLRARVGWPASLVGRVFEAGGAGSQAGVTPPNDGPLAVEDLPAETCFDAPLLREHGVIGGLSAVIRGALRPYGVLSVHTTRERAFTADDVHFLQSVADLLGLAMERAHAQQALLSSRAQQEAILHGVADGITAQDQSGQLVFANDAAARILGFPSAQAMLATPVPDLLRRYDLFDEVGRPLPADELPGRRVLRGEPASERLVGSRVRATGEERWAVVRATPLLDDQGQVRLAINIFHDVTERRRAGDALRFLVEASGVLAASLESEATLQRVAELAVPRLADWCVVHLVEPVGPPRAVAIAHADPAKGAFARAIDRRYPPAADAPAGPLHVIRTGQAEIETDVAEAMLAAAAQDDEHLRLLREVGMRSYLSVPLQARGRVFGALTLIAAESGRRFERPDLALAEELASHAALAVDNARLYEQLAERERQLQDLVGRLLATQEEERRRVAYDVHDGLAQVAASAYQHLQTFADRHPPRSSEARAELDRAVQLAQQTIAEARRVIAGLRPAALDDLGLAAALRWQLDELSAKGVEGTSDIEPDDERLPWPVETALFRVAQEALANAHKHSGSARVHVALAHRGRLVRLEVRDWGRGFDPAAPTAGTGPGERLGLIGMRERVALLGGRCEVRSRPGQGTRVVAEVPLAVTEGGLTDDHD